MQAVDTLSARSPSLGYWISLGLVPFAFLLFMSLRGVTLGAFAWRLQRRDGWFTHARQGSTVIHAP